MPRPVKNVLGFAVSPKNMFKIFALQAHRKVETVCCRDLWQTSKTSVWLKSWIIPIKGNCSTGMQCGVRLGLLSPGVLWSLSTPSPLFGEILLPSSHQCFHLGTIMSALLFWSTVSLEAVPCEAWSVGLKEWGAIYWHIRVAGGLETAVSNYFHVRSREIVGQRLHRCKSEDGSVWHRCPCRPSSLPQYKGMWRGCLRYFLWTLHVRPHLTERLCLEIDNFRKLF